MIVYISVLRWLDNKGNKEEKKKKEGRVVVP